MLILGAVVATPMAAEKGKPLSVRDVSELLKGSMPSSEIARLVGEDGITFRLFDGLENQFRQSVATDESRGWQRAGFWKRGTYRVDLFVNGTLIGSSNFTIY